VKVSYEETGRRVDALTDHEAFERLVTILLARTGLNVRPLGGSGDRGRDAVVGLHRADAGEDLAITISLNTSWAAKIRSDVERVHSQGFKPSTVISVTNRSASASAQIALQRKVKKAYGADLTIYDRRWLITQMHLRENLDLRGEFLNLSAPRPRFFLDIGEFEELLQRRGMLAAPFEGRAQDIDELERLLVEDRRAVIVEADGGYGKTRLAFELARSGRSATQWFFVDRGLGFDLEYLAETEAGYEATVLVDDAHRRGDLEQLLRALERRQPVPRLVFTVRPGHRAAVEALLHELALEPMTLQLDPVGRSALDAILQTEPFEIAREGMRAAIIAVSEGNIGIALIAATLAAQGIEPYELSRAELFSRHVELRLRGAGAGSRETREVLALLSALGGFDLSDANDVAAANSLLGGDAASLRRRLDELADSGIVVEQPENLYTIKPDIVREHLLRASFFPDKGRPVLRYLDVWNAFSSRRLRAMLAALGEARVDTAPAAAEALRTVRRAILDLLEAATDVGALSAVADLARALGVGGAEIALELVEAICDRLDTLDDEAADVIGTRLVEALAVAKFGLDQLPLAWSVLLRLATIVSSREAPQAREGALKEIREIYGSVPMNYSPGEAYLLGYVQRAVREQTLEWWGEAKGEPAARLVAAAVVQAAFQLQLESHRTSAANAMAITLLGGFVPTTRETEELLRLGARLFRETFRELTPPDQLKELEALDSLAHVAAGYSGLFGAIPPKELQLLARDVLAELEQWLAKQLDDLALPVAAAILSYFRLRRRRRKQVPSPRPAGELRTYVDLVDNHPRGHVRLDWEKELAEVRERGARYGRTLVKAKDPIAVLEHWNAWIEQCESLTGKPANHMTINAALEEVTRADLELARELAKHMIENELAISRFSDWMLDALARDQESWPLIQAWAQHPSATARRAAARAMHRAPDALLRRVAPTLAEDPDSSVRSAIWQALTYGASEPPSGWRLNLALEITESSEAPLDLLDQLLSLVRHRSQADMRPPRLTVSQRERVRRIMLASAAVDDIPRQHRVQMALEEAERFGLDLVLPWLRARLDHVKRRANGHYYIHPLPDELHPLVYTRRTSAAGRRELRRLLDEVEKPSTKGMYRYGVDEAITWLGADSAEVTRRVAKWAKGSMSQRRLALSFLGSGNWAVFTRRARLVLNARPFDPEIRRALIYAREPMSFVGSREPYYRGRADEYRRWLHSKDSLLGEIAREAVEHYEQLADEAEDYDRRERDRI
jgi:hypothetical protein